MPERALAKAASFWGRLRNKMEEWRWRKIMNHKVGKDHSVNTFMITPNQSSTVINDGIGMLSSLS
jgi:hypothetical protein